MMHVQDLGTLLHVGNSELCQCFRRTSFFYQNDHINIDVKNQTIFDRAV